MKLYTRPLLLAMTIAATWLIMLSMMVIPGHAASVQSVQLTWTAPTLNANGSTLNDLAGYKVYYGLATGIYTDPIPVGLSTNYMLSGLAEGVQYYIAVTAYDTDGNESTFSNEVRFPNNVLVANFTATPTSGSAPLAVTFTSTSTGNPTAWAWNFDDGSTSNQPTITHTFTGPRTYNVTLTVSAGSLSNTVTKPITVAQQPTASPGLVAAYSFNEGSGTTVTDSSGNGNHGTISGADWTTNGRSGSALYFGGNDGNNDRVTIPASTSLDLTTNMTLEAWVYPPAVPNWRTVIGKGTSGNLVY